jgi:hypothetical protein
MTSALATFGVMLFICASAAPKARKAPPPAPDQLIIGRHTFVDFGPPLDFYEVFSLRSEGQGTSIDRMRVTPAADACLRPATVRMTTVSVNETLADLLGQTSPCGIPEKDLRRELKRCKKCLVFSGAEVVMQVQCGDQSRHIRMDILDRDMFDAHATTPVHTSWTMALLGRVDRALGDGVMDQPAFTLSEPPKPPKPGVKANALLEGLGRGKFDALFDKAPDKLSELLRQAQNNPPKPSAELLSSSPFRPIYNAPLNFPPLAKMAHIATK